ncbi:hypothetical protein [Actinomadura atramentaria]|uniref:hypothetical protein n=1 Tax=Actinomadura atramentaria TaxID=1990 RepID=UPI000364C551|nr:hypothetical protein [Actinomadura atramentaria]
MTTKNTPAAVAFAVAVCVAVALPQFAGGPARVAAGLVYMLAGVLLFAAPRPRAARIIVSAPHPDTVINRREAVSGPLSRWEDR